MTQAESQGERAGSTNPFDAFLAERDMAYIHSASVHWTLGKLRDTCAHFVFVPDLQHRTSEIAKWCMDHLRDPYSVFACLVAVQPNENVPAGIVYGFRSEIDAIHFKLRWGSGA